MYFKIDQKSIHFFQTTFLFSLGTNLLSLNKEHACLDFSNNKLKIPHCLFFNLMKSLNKQGGIFSQFRSFIPVCLSIRDSRVNKYGKKANCRSLLKFLGRMSKKRDYVLSNSPNLVPHSLFNEGSRKLSVTVSQNGYE